MTDEGDRPDACECEADDRLVCWSCFTAGYSTINPNAPSERQPSNGGNNA